MLTALQTRKLTRLFSLYDVNRNGVVERGDYQLVAHSTAQALGYTTGSPEYDALCTEYMASWDNLQQLADSNNDTELTQAEFLTGYDKLMAQTERFNSVILGLAKNTLLLQDRDKDGKVSQQEHRDFLVAFNTTEAEATDTFHRLDRDGDGFLTTEEMALNTKEFFLSDDSQAPGNWLVGPY
ncbi:MAG: hypothetical protein R3E79_46695 [Caldilineaceae bacterium]